MSPLHTLPAAMLSTTTPLLHTGHGVLSLPVLSKSTLQEWQESVDGLVLPLVRGEAAGLDMVMRSSADSTQNLGNEGPMNKSQASQPRCFRACGD